MKKKDNLYVLNPTLNLYSANHHYDYYSTIYFFQKASLDMHNTFLDMHNTCLDMHETCLDRHKT